jgi:predicted phosphate transport protein (TIGR00153 family)
MALLKKIHELELKIDQFLNMTSECGILFEQFVKLYILEKGTDCAIKVSKIRENERVADDLRTQIEKYLYSHTLIPENRGDVLGILEMTDEVIDQIKEIIVDMQIEKPFIPEFMFDGFRSLTVASANSVDEMTKAVRAFFYNVHDVDNYVHKVLYYEKEADDLAERMKTELYQYSPPPTPPHSAPPPAPSKGGENMGEAVNSQQSTEITLAQKNHLKYFIRGVEKISDYAQDVADRLIIYTMKREL